jgi:DNA polymerase III alpha subunit
MKYAKFPCGCSFPMTDNGKIKFEVDWDTLNYDCSATWDLISSGNTKGVFQIESRFGQQLSKKAPVRSLEDLGNLTAIMRPGCSEAKLDNITLTDHYLNRKAGRSEVKYYHPSLEGPLKTTYGILVYQEQAMRIAQELAGFNLMEADDLRKAAGKKKADLMAKIKIKFIEGCIKVGKVNEKEADEIWGWIEASQRYSFNKSHAIGYAYLAYLTAYIKQHFPLEMFTSWLGHAGDKQGKKQEEIQELIANAKKMNFEVNRPKFENLNRHFEIHNGEIYFGFTEVSGVGDSVFDKMLKTVTELEAEIGPRKSWTYMDIMMRLFPKINSKAIKALISVGTFDDISSKRTLMNYEFDKISELTDKVFEWCIENYRNYSGVTDMLKGCINNFKFRQPATKIKLLGIINSLEKPPYSLNDTAEVLAGEEKRLLGVSLTCSTVDGCDISVANVTCKEFASGKVGYCMLPIHVDSVKEVTIKNGDNRGKKMAFLSGSDNTCSLEGIVVFNDVWSKAKSIITPGNTIMIGGIPSDKDKSSLIVQKVWQL